MKRFHRRKVLIWGKTAPELSKDHLETVCTGGCLEDGSPIRLYPIPFRYLPSEQQFTLYQWISVPIAKSRKDSRPESYKAKPQEIEVLEGPLPTRFGWEVRRNVIFRDPDWQFRCRSELEQAQETSGQSLGIVKVNRVEKVERYELSEEERRRHEEKLAGKKAQVDIFGREVKDLALIPERIRLYWSCDTGNSDWECPGHTGTVFDWGLYELGRRESLVAMQDRMEELCQPDKYDLHLFLGNLNRRRHIFTVVGLWYPLKREMQQKSLFMP